MCVNLARDARARIINIMFFTRASHDHGSGTAYDRHYRCIEAAEWTESEWTASGKCLQSCHKSHHRVFMCTIGRKII